MKIENNKDLGCLENAGEVWNNFCDFVSRVWEGYHWFCLGEKLKENIGKNNKNGII